MLSVGLSAMLQKALLLMDVFIMGGWADAIVLEPAHMLEQQSL